ncbi:MAG TPA: hypothetical protein VF221_12805 [Chloroflexota bacterium]
MGVMVDMHLSETFGISKTDRLADPYITGGDRAYLVGTQDGAFPDLGWHIPGEMGGLWAPPIKLFDGFWLEVDGSWLTGADEFVSGPFWNTHRHALHEAMEVTRRQFVPDGHPGIVVSYTLRSRVSRRVQLRFLARSDFQHVWSPAAADEDRAPDSARYSDDLGAWICTDSRGARCAIVGAIGLRPEVWHAGHGLWGPEQTRGNGISVALSYGLELAAGENTTLHFVLCGSATGCDPAMATFLTVSEELEALWTSKQTRYRNLAQESVLEIPDQSITRAWDWIKYDYDWLVCEVPGVGRGVTAGAPDYMWWFGCDSAYAVLGCLALGQHETAIATLDVVRERSCEANGASGRVLHECTTQGEVVHNGCTQETPHFTEAVWATFLWTGDLAFLRRGYDFCRRGVLDLTIGELCVAGELLPYGYGITEVEGMDLQCIDSAVHTVCALDALAGMADVLGDTETAALCRHASDMARRQLDEAFWLDGEGLYADMRATPQEMAPRLRKWISAVESREYTQGRQSSLLADLKALLEDAESDPNPERKRGWLLENWTIITPLEVGLTEPGRAVRALDRIESREFVGPSGMYLSGLDHTHVMSINTGALAVATLQYGRVEKGLAHVRTMTDTLQKHMPGAISEMLPDYGCFVQAWSGYAVVWPVVAHVFGLRPNAHARTLEMNACFPSGWEGAALSNVRIGNGRFDFHWDGSSLQVRYDDEDDWSVTSSTVRVNASRHAHMDAMRRPLHGPSSNDQQGRGR